MSDGEFYLRRCALTVLTWGGDTIRISSDLRITFRVEKNFNNQFYQFAEITVYNLDPDTETNIFKNGQSVTLEAGYQTGPYGQIFRGDLFQAIRGKEDEVTYFLRLVCYAGLAELGLNFCNFTVASNQTARDIANQIARSATVPFQLSIDQTLQLNQSTQRAKVVIGSPGEHLRSIALNNNAIFYFDDGIANLVPINTTPPANPPELNAQTGMIGIPHQQDFGITIRSLINPNFRIGSFLKINNKDIIVQQLEFSQLPVFLEVDGIYRIISLTAIGDTRGNDWYFDMETWGHNGQLPDMLANQTQVGV